MNDELDDIRLRWRYLKDLGECLTGSPNSERRTWKLNKKVRARLSIRNIDRVIVDWYECDKLGWDVSTWYTRLDRGASWKADGNFRDHDHYDNVQSLEIAALALDKFIGVAYNYKFRAYLSDMQELLWSMAAYIRKYEIP